MGDWADMAEARLWEEPEYPNGSDNAAVWVDREENQTPLELLETSHIKNILAGFERGNSYFGQEWKAPSLKKILKKRLTHDT